MFGELLETQQRGYFPFMFSFPVKSPGSGLSLFKESGVRVISASGSISERCLKVLNSLLLKSLIDLSFLCLWDKIAVQSVFTEQTLRMASCWSCSMSTGFLTPLNLYSSKSFRSSSESFHPDFSIQFFASETPINANQLIINLGFLNYLFLK